MRSLGRSIGGKRAATAIQAALERGRQRFLKSYREVPEGCSYGSGNNWGRNPTTVPSISYEAIYYRI
jgi:hypothetical protein